MLRLSVTALETLRYWKSREDSTLDDLIAQLTYREMPTPQMESGRAFAKIMEHADGVLIDVEQDGWKFHFALDGEIALPPIRELKGEMQIKTPSGPVTLVGKVDALSGLIVRDAKLTENFDAERYLDSLQWRSYCLMFGARAFVYDVFVCRRDEVAKEVTVTDYHPLTFYTYPGIRTDVEAAVCELAEVVTRYIPELMKG